VPSHSGDKYFRGLLVTTEQKLDNPSLDSQWLQRVREVGKRNFENEEMLRLGFLTVDDLKVATDSEAPEKYRAALEALAVVRRKLQKADERVVELHDVEYLIREIRSRRIERVKAERVERRAQREEARKAKAVENRRRSTEEPTYLGRAVSHGLRFEGGDAALAASLQLPELHTFLDLANTLSQTPGRLQWLTYERAADATDHYTRFEIPKRSGGTRLISSPKPALRTAQEWVRLEILSHLSVNSAAMAFRPGRSIVDNARLHADSGLVIRIDLKDFFPSITFDRVRGFFASLGYNSGVATVLALICTDTPRARVTLDGETTYAVVGQRALPQGACTSPDLANLIAATIDARLTGLATKHGWTYTRYADDLVFSHKESNTDAAQLVRIVTRIVSDEGFRVNTKKTRIMRSPNRQMVTGLLVNQGVRLTRKDLRKIRAFLHRCDTQGIEQVSAEIGKDARAVARGYYAYVHMITPETARAMRAKHSWI